MAKKDRAQRKWVIACVCCGCDKVKKNLKRWIIRCLHTGSDCGSGSVLDCNNHFTAVWTLSGTTWLSRYQKVHFAVFWIFWSKMRITHSDAPTVWMDCHPIQTNWCPHLCHPHHFYVGCPSLHNPPNLSWLGTGTNYAGLRTRWFGCHTFSKRENRKQKNALPNWRADACFSPTQTSKIGNTFLYLFWPFHLVVCHGLYVLLTLTLIAQAVYLVEHERLMHRQSQIHRRMRIHMQRCLPASILDVRLCRQCCPLVECITYSWPWMTDIIHRTGYT